MTLRFKGFPDAESVTISVTAGGETEAATAPNWGNPPASDTTPPVLSNAGGTPAGANGGVGSVSTNESGGTLHWVCSIFPSTPTVAEVKAGQSSTGGEAAAFNSQPVNFAGLQTTSPAASPLLGDTEYYFFFVHTDAAGNDSAVAAAPAFRTAASGGAQSVTISILARTRLEMAPEAVMFQATPSGFTNITPSTSKNNWDEATHYVHYGWSVRRVGQSLAARPGTRHINLLTAWNDTNVGYGRQFGHMFNEPGDYVVNVFALNLREKPETASASFTITIKDPDVECAGSRTVIYNPAGSAVSGYAGANVQTTWTAALNALGQINGACRLGLVSGLDATVSEVNITSTFDHFYVFHAGTGTRPILRTQNDDRLFDVLGSFDGDVRLQKLDLIGPWDSTTEAGSHPGNCVTLSGGPPNHLMVDDCLMSGWRQTISGQKNPNSPQLLAVHNSHITNWADYGIYQPTGPNAYLIRTASRICQDEQAMMGGDPGKSGISNQHGPERIAGAGYCYMDCCELFSRNGWNNNNPGGFPPEQPCVRWNTGHQPGFHSGCFRTVMEGGNGSVVNTTASGSSGAKSVANVLMDSCIIIGTARTSNVVSFAYGGCTFRNGFAIKPKTPRVTPISGDFNHMFTLSLGGRSDEVAIYNNTMINWLGPQDTDNNHGKYSGFGSGTNVKEYNNFQASPNDLSQEHFDPEIDVSTALAVVAGVYDAQHLGFKFNNYGKGSTPNMDTTYKVPDGAATLPTLVPEAGSPVLSGSSGVTPYLDIMGNVRGSNPARGAVERV